MDLSRWRSSQCIVRPIHLVFFALTLGIKTAYCEWIPVLDVTAPPEGQVPGFQAEVRYTKRYDVQQSAFDRLPPKALDEQVFVDFARYFSRIQEFSGLPNASNQYNILTKNYVAIIPNARVERTYGLVYDQDGHVLHQREHFLFRGVSLPPLPIHLNEDLERLRDEGLTVYYPALATTIQDYGWMFYHMLMETLPKAALLSELVLHNPDEPLRNDIKVLAYGLPFEIEYFKLIGINEDQIVRYDPDKIYLADKLYYPTPTPRVLPSRESLLMIRKALHVVNRPPEDRDLIIYVSRRRASSRRIAHEEQLLDAMRREFPDENLIIFDGSSSPKEAIDLFGRAKVVMGPHGAGLSHLLFCAPGTVVIEILFMYNPPMMFWHSSRALSLDYYMVPAPQSYWLQEEFAVPIREVIQIVKVGLRTYSDLSKQRMDRLATTCPPGWGLVSQSGQKPGEEGRCEICGPGFYSYLNDDSSCEPCYPGRYATESGSVGCRTCPGGMFSISSPQGNDSSAYPNWTEQEEWEWKQGRGTICEDCRLGRMRFLGMPGSYSKETCVLRAKDVVTNVAFDRAWAEIDRKSKATEPLNNKGLPPLRDTNDLTIVDPEQPGDSEQPHDLEQLEDPKPRKSSHTTEYLVFSGIILSAVVIFFMRVVVQLHK